MVYATCDSDSFSRELQEYKYRTNIKVLRNDYNYTLQTNVKDVVCTCERKPIAKYILPTTENVQHVISYPGCARVLFTAFMRQLRAPTRSPSPILISQYHKFCDKFFEKEIEPIIKDFSYDVEAWMNHLKTYNKQFEVLEFYNRYKKGELYHHSYADPENFVYTLFAKKEKQIVTDKKPKCRAISAAPPLVKFILGPVVQKLEKLLHGPLHGYKMSQGGKPCKTWHEMEEMYNSCYKEGLDTIIDIDGSAWDSTQHFDMKYLTHKIYKYLVEHNKIHHIDPELFKKVALQRERKLVAKCYIDGKTHIIFSAIIDGTTFSGSPDTTFMNTLTNLSLNHFIFDMYGIEDHLYKMNSAGDDYNTLISAELNTQQLRDFIKEVWLDLGLLPKYVLHGGYDQITFCSTNVIPYQTVDNETQFKIVRQMDRMIPLSLISEKALSYSNGRLKYHYLELSNGLKTWASELPFYKEFIAAYMYQHDKIPQPYELDKPGKQKMRFEAVDDYDEESYSDMTKVRISQHNPEPKYVYNFLREKFGLLKENINQIATSLKSKVLYSPYEPNETSCTMDPFIVTGKQIGRAHV